MRALKSGIAGVLSTIGAIFVVALVVGVTLLVGTILPIVGLVLAAIASIMVLAAIFHSILTDKPRPPPS